MWLTKDSQPQVNVSERMRYFFIFQIFDLTVHKFGLIYSVVLIERQKAVGLIEVIPRRFPSLGVTQSFPKEEKHFRGIKPIDIYFFPGRSPARWFLP